MEEDDYPVPQYSESATGSTQQSGSMKRKKANSLPRMFLAYDWVGKAIIGAVLAATCTQCGTGPDAKFRWVVSAACELERPFDVSSDMIRFHGNVFNTHTLSHPLPLFADHR